MWTRDTSRDGFLNKLEFFFLTHFGFAWTILQAMPFVRRWLNRFLINRAVNKTEHRPHQFSTLAEYTSWSSLTDHTFSGRHLPEATDEYMASLPDVEEVVALFARPEGGQRLSAKSTLLFSHFAQWFTDGFLRTHPEDLRKNTSNHDIDLSTLYGIQPSHTSMLRKDEGGLLKSQHLNGEEYPPFYFDSDGKPLDEFKDLPITFPKPPWLPAPPLERKTKLFAMGVERANNQVGFVMLNTLFLREHNRVCKLLSNAHPTWDDERLFQTTRCILIVMLIRIVVEEYINHITPYHFKFRVAPSSFWDAPWYRTNWMTVEFNLLYRWHSLVPDQIKQGAEELPLVETFFNNELLISRGLAACFTDASSQPSGELGISNTADSLMRTERASVHQSRELKLRSYNDYREAFGYPRLTCFTQVCSSVDRQKQLKEVYGHVDKLELYTGLFAEDVRRNSALSPLIGRMVGVDAFSQALTNPLLSRHVYNEQTFSREGWELIQSTKRLIDIVKRNVPDVSALEVSLTLL